MSNNRQLSIWQKPGELVKHSAAVQISNKISLTERRIWNVCLQHAYDQLPREETHAIAVRELIGRTRLNTENFAYVKECFENLVGTHVRWNLLGKDDKEEWGVAALLADAVIRNGVIYYSFGPQLRQRLHNPRMFARIQLSIQSEFSHKYALPLYELLVDYQWSSGVCEAPRMTIKDARKLLGVEEGSYKQFYDFRRYVLDRAVEEVNDKSDIHVEYDAQKTGRSYTHVKFTGRRHSPQRNSLT